MDKMDSNKKREIEGGWYVGKKGIHRLTEEEQKIREEEKLREQIRAEFKETADVVEEKIKLIQKLGGRGEQILKENINKNEEKMFVTLQGSFGEGLVITDKRLYVLKWGWMAGNILGGRCGAFDFNSITGLEIKKGLLTGTFEVLTPATQNAQKSYWGINNKNAIKSDNVITFQQNKFNLFQEATKIGRELINKTYPKGGWNSQEKPDYSELEKLAELKEKGIITQEEFEAKKKRILGL